MVDFLLKKYDNNDLIENIAFITVLMRRDILAAATGTFPQQ